MYPMARLKPEVAGRTVVAVNCGGSTYVDAEGTVYSADAYDNNTAPSTTSMRTKSIIGTRDSALYQASSPCSHCHWLQPRALRGLRR